MQVSRGFICGIVFIFGFAATASADNVYRWTDTQGKVHYSSKAPDKKAKPANLPPIMREKVKAVKSELVTCDKHGGIDCSSGPDGDGSVVCLDGFKNSSTRFRFSCQTAKLEITDISEPEESGAFKVFVRNSKSVVAASPSVVFKSDLGDKARLSGPAQIEGYGVAEFNYKGSKPTTRPDMGKLELACLNCP
jgi:hypothetical protein